MSETNDKERFLSDVREMRDEQRKAMQWRREHLAAFMLAVRACDDVQTLRALAHRLGYKEGM